MTPPKEPKPEPKNKQQTKQEREQAIRAVHPDVLDVDWSAIFSDDPEVFTKLLSEVIKADKLGKPGKRPSIKRPEATKRLALISGEDFSEHDFYTTFTAMCGDRSIAHIASKTGLHKSYVQRLLNRTGKPSISALEAIAKAFGHHPSFFIEYRIHHVLTVLESFLWSAPETSAAWYLKFKGNEKIRIN